MVDLTYFMVIMLVFIVAYGITSQVILYPNSELNGQLVVDILKYAWWSIFGEFNIEEVSGQYKIELQNWQCSKYLANFYLISSKG